MSLDVGASPITDRCRVLLLLSLLCATSGPSCAAESGTAHDGTSSAAASASEGRAAVELEAVRLRPRIVAVHPHDPEAYTQGLLWHQGRVWESTGRYGQSSVRRWRLEDGVVEWRAPLDDDLFGEGLALVDDRLLQLTWQAGEALVWRLPQLELETRLNYQGEGWGLAWTGDRLFQSDGTHLLRIRDPRTFEETGRLEVRRDGLRADGLNELEWAEGRLWANVYQTDEILRIDPATGRVDGVVDASGLLEPEEARRAEVLNGIAYRPETRTFLVTGKLWPRLFEVVFEELAPP